MRKYHPHESHVEHPNVVPLVDIFLCLIVFYMLAARIGVATGIDTEITVVTTKLGNSLTLSNTLILNVREVAGAPLVSALLESTGSTETIPINDLGRVLRALRIGPDNRENSPDDNPELKLIIRADENITYRSFQPVMIAINESGIQNIFHNTKEPE